MLSSAFLRHHACMWYTNTYADKTLILKKKLLQGEKEVTGFLRHRHIIHFSMLHTAIVNHSLSPLSSSFSLSLFPVPQYVALAGLELCRTNGLWLNKLPASIFRVLGLQVCIVAEGSTRSMHSTEGSAWSVHSSRRLNGPISFCARKCGLQKKNILSPARVRRTPIDSHQLHDKGSTSSRQSWGFERWISG